MEKSLKGHIEYFKTKRDSLKNAEDVDTLGRAAVLELSSLTDVFLVSIFSQAERKWQKESGGTLRSVALIPIGGYGRSELALNSDIDLMILCRPATDPVVEYISEHIFYPLWDAGLEIGHSVRTIGDCVDMARENFHTQTSFLDARCLAGNRELFRDFQKYFNANVIQGRRKNFLENVLAENEKRYARFGEGAYLLEPNIKEGRGGLRDYHSLLWAGKALFDLHDLDRMEGAAIISASDRAALEKALDFLWKVRNQLHILSARKNDQLYFEYQEDIARNLGFVSREDFLPVEEFMRRFHTHASYIESLSDIVFERILHSLKIKPAGHSEYVPDHSLEKDVIIEKGEIRIENEEVFQKKPHLLMKIFEHAAKFDAHLNPQIYQSIADNLNLVDDAFRSSRKVCRIFFSLLSAGRQAYPQLETMFKVGLLTKYIPEMEAIRCQVQFDSYHVYTVDKHSLLTFQELGFLQEQKKYPFAELKNPEHLFFVALLHDIGKGTGRNHAERGANIITHIAGRIGLDEKTASDMAAVVRNHLLLSDVAMRRDLEDEKVIVQCAKKIETVHRLNQLYLLTISDSRATGPRAWTEWKAALLEELYFKIKHVLEKGQLAAIDSAARKERVLNNLKQNLEARSRPDQVSQLKYLPESYLLTVPFQKILKHLSMKSELQEKRFTVSYEPKQNHWDFTVAAQDRPGLFYSISGVLTLNDFDILAAQIFTWNDGTAVELFKIKELIPGTLNEFGWLKLVSDIEKTLTGRLSLGYRLAEKKARLFSKNRVRDIPSQVLIDNEGSDLNTVIEVYTRDRVGLLYTLAKTLFDAGLNIKSAKISTKVDQIVDVFYVQDFYGQKITHPEQCQEIKKALLFKLDGNKKAEKQGKRSYVI